MARFLLDTNIITEGVAPRPDRQLLEKLDRHSHECATATPVLHELRYGVELLERSKRRATLETYIEEVVLRVYPLLSYDRRAAEWHGRERARLRKAGREPPYFDGLIASIARVNDLVLVTTNVSDFERYDGLQIENWRERRPG
jgi:tRNA(fMet)-specific endonuclease VapC